MAVINFGLTNPDSIDTCWFTTTKADIRKAPMTKHAIYAEKNFKRAAR